MQEHLTSSLQDCNAKRTKYLDELTNLVISPEEEQILMGDQTPIMGESLASDTSSVTGHLAMLHVCNLYMRCLRMVIPRSRSHLL